MDENPPIPHGDGFCLRDMEADLKRAAAQFDKYPNAVALFGSARTQRGSRWYRLAEQIAFLLAMEGLTVITGGGPGEMEAGNRGAREAGGRSVAFGIELPAEQGFNDFVEDPVMFGHFSGRKMAFVGSSKAFVFMPGGFGTLDELFEVLCPVQTGKLSRRPIVLVGTEFWEGMIAWMKETLVPEGTINASDLELLTLVDSAEAAVSAIMSGLSA